ncbi:MAG: DUF6382 domain-containing protein [Lachnospiraceae bacterium]|nr:DUF6382 domain-containing protein [Lachnospiraceae bacterium]
MIDYVEGLKVYKIEEEVRDAYFLSTEYYVIRKNQIGTLIPMIFREENGTRKLLYDVTENVTLETYAKKKLSGDQIKKFLEDLVRLMEDLDHYMLKMSHIPLKEDAIYVDQNQNFHWLYLSSEIDEYDGRQELENLISWMLSQMDYQDREGVEFLYQFYWCIRNQSFTRKMVEDFLEGRSENQNPEKEQALESDSQMGAEEQNWSQEINSLPSEGDQVGPYEKEESYYQGNQSERSEWHSSGNPYGSSSQYGSGISYDRASYHYHNQYGSLNSQDDYDEEDRKTEEVQKKWVKPVLILLSVAALVDLGLSLYVFYLAYRYGFPPSCIKYLAGCGGLLVVLLIIIIRIKMEYLPSKRKRKPAPEKNPYPQDHYQENFYPQQTNAYPSASYSANAYPVESDHWEENKTVVLTEQRQGPQACLKDLESGKIHLIHKVPYYIGSSEETNQLVLKDETVSRAHAVINKDEINGEYLVEDLHSTNGTEVDHVRVASQAVLLKNQSEITFAKRQFKFLIIQ